ncbi:hypothetical protein FOXYSP1_11549 [Fusarium oxysporum f. sp. phaseoli]
MKSRYNQLCASWCGPSPAEPELYGEGTATVGRGSAGSELMSTLKPIGTTLYLYDKPLITPLKRI